MINQALLIQPEEIKLLKVNESVIESGKVLIRVDACGICRSDLDMFSGKRKQFVTPTLMGHEFIGTIVNKGVGISEDIVGKKVVINPLVGCGKCFNCINGYNNYCENLQVIGFGLPGGMCDYTLQDVSQVLLLENHLHWKNSVLIEPLAVAINSVENLMINEMNRILILGGGTIGYLISKLIKFRFPNVEILVLARKKAWINLFEKIGCKIYTNEGDMNKDISNDQRSTSIDVIFECTGNDEIANNALKMIRRGGTLILVGIPEKKKFLLYKKIQDRSITVRGINMYNNSQFYKAVQLTNSGFEMSEIISHEFPLASVDKAFRFMLDNKEETMKIIIRG